MTDKKRIAGGLFVFVISCISVIAFSLFVTPKLGIAGCAVSEIVLFAIPFFAVKLKKENFLERFSVSSVPAGKILGAILLSAGATFLSSALVRVTSAFVPEAANIDSGLWDAFLAPNSKTAVIISVIVLPAICEELLFRGYIQTSFRSIHPSLAISVVGILFGLMHFDLYKLLPAAVMGTAYAYIAYVTGSVLPSIMCHLINNAWSVVNQYSSHSPAVEGDAFEIIVKPSSNLILAVVALCIGFVIGYLGFKMLTGKKMKKPFGVLSVILCFAICIGCSVALVKNEFTVEMETESRYQVYEKKLDLDCDRLCVITISAYGDRSLPVEIKITDENGDTVYSSENTLGISTPLEKGKYTVTASTGVDGENVQLNLFIGIGPELKKVVNTQADNVN